jgi:hypothetical protein
MQSFPYSPRELKVTEARLSAIYEASALGLKGDKLALAAGLLPSEYRQLCQLDPNVELMAMKGAADAEAQMAQVLKDAALGGDTKAALAILQNIHGWASAKEQNKVAFGITNADGTAASLVIGWES